MSNNVARRLLAIEGIDLSEADRESIVAEFDDFDRALAELAEFARPVPWLAQQVQPRPGEAQAHGN